MEHWLPLFEDKLATLFDHLGEHDVIIRDVGADGALEARPSDRRIISPIASGRWSPSRAVIARWRHARSTCRESEWKAALERAAYPPDFALSRT